MGSNRDIANMAMKSMNDTTNDSAANAYIISLIRKVKAQAREDSYYRYLRLTQSPQQADKMFDEFIG